MAQNNITLETLVTMMEDISGKLNRMEKAQQEVKNEITKIQSEVRSRYYDMQNLAYAGHSISDPGYVSTAAAVGRSPRRHINSYDTFH